MRLFSLISCISKFVDVYSYLITCQIHTATLYIKLLFALADYQMQISVRKIREKKMLLIC